MSYAIEDGVPLPETRNGRGRKPVYPIAALEPGQSFFVPGGAQKVLCRCAKNIANKTGRKFTTRAVNGGVRVWRVS